MANNQKKTDRKTMITRVVCLSLAGILILTTLLSAILSQIW